MRDILFAFTWTVTVAVAFRAAYLCVLLWIWVALLSPSELMYGIAGSVPLNKMIAAITVIVLLIRREKAYFYADTLIGLVAAFSVVLFLSYLFAIAPVPSADTLLDKYWKELVLLFLITGTLASRHRLHQTAITISLAFGFIMAKEGLIFLLTAGGHKVGGTSATGDNNGLALAILMAIPIMLYSARFTVEKWIKAGMYLTAGLGVVTIVATYSRGGFVGLLALGLMTLQGTKNKIRSMAVIALVGVALYALMPESYLGRVDTITTATEDSSFVTRLIAWKVNLFLALDHPILGGGPYASLSLPTWSAYAAASAGALFPTPFSTDRTFVAHSIYFQALGDTGFLGFGLFMSVLGVALLYCTHARRIAGRDPSLSWIGELARALNTSVVVYCVAGAALTANYSEFLFILLAVISRLHKTALDLATSGSRERAPIFAGMRGSSGPLMNRTESVMAGLGTPASAVRSGPSTRALY